jgi:hypothetical protein
VVDADGVVTSRVDSAGGNAEFGGQPIGNDVQQTARDDAAMIEAVAPGADALPAELAAAGSYVAQGEEVEQVLRKPDPMTEEQPEFKPSAVEGVGRGGVTQGSNGPQIAEVKRLSKENSLGPAGLITFMIDHGVLDRKIGEAMLQIPDKAGMATALTNRLDRLNGNEVGKLIHDMREAFGGAAS